MAPDMQLAMAAAVTADRITLPAFGKGNLTVDVKPDLSPVSEADRAVEVAKTAVEVEASGTLRQVLGVGVT